MRHPIFASIVIALSAAGCVSAETGAPAPSATPPTALPSDGHVDAPVTPATPSERTLRAALARPRTLVVDPESSVGSIAVRYRDETTPREVQLGVRQGALTVEATSDGTLEIRGLVFALDDIAGAPLFEGGDPVPLTDVRASVATPIRCRPYFTDDDGAATCDVQADVALEWSLALEDGRAWPLDPQTLGGVRFALHLFVREDGRVGLDVDSASPTGTWQIADVAELSRFALIAEAIELPHVR